MLNRVITISREFGSGGRTIGKKWLKNWAFPVTMQSYMAFGPPSRACDCLAVNDKGNDRSNRFLDPKRIPDANRSEKPAE